MRKNDLKTPPQSFVLNRPPAPASTLVSTAAAPPAQTPAPPVQARFGHSFSQLALTAGEAAQREADLTPEATQQEESSRQQSVFAPVQLMAMPAITGEFSSLQKVSLPSTLKVGMDKPELSPEKPAASRIGLTTGSASNGVMQRVIKVSMKGNIVVTKQDSKRPVGGVSGGKQGDHTTPFTVLQNELANAVEGSTLADAWASLLDTYNVYTNLPGWAISTKYVTNTLGNYVFNLLTAEGDVKALQVAINQMLVLRNQIALTSLPKGGHGNAEGKWAGSLQYQERQLQLGHQPDVDKDEVIEYMWNAFDHKRVDKLGDAKRDEIIEQHATTMEDAYPQLNEYMNIDADDIMDGY